MKHTPGPWKFDPDAFNTNCRGSCNEDSVGSIRDEADGFFIAKIEGNINPEDERASEFANARLIAAAPELLEACKWFVAQLEAGTIVRDITKDAEPSWALKMMRFVTDLNKATAAVAKAESMDPANGTASSPNTLAEAK